MRVDKAYPLLLSPLITGVMVYLVTLNRVNLVNFDKLIDVSINIAGILLGFLITLHGILISMRGNSKVMKALKEAKSLPDLNIFLKDAIVSSAIVLLYCLLTIVFNFEFLSAIGASKILFLIWVLLASYMALCSYRFISTFITIMNHEDSSPN